MRVLSLFVCVMALVSFSSCETMSADDCASVDWTLKGQEDGRYGYTTSRLNRHSKACIKHGAIVDKKAYLAGRKTGLKSYCTPDNAYTKAKNDRGRLNVCSELGSTLMSKLNQAYRAGCKVAGLKRDLSSVLGQIDDLEKEKELASRMAVKREISSSLSRLNRQRYDLDYEISAAEREGEQVVRSLSR